MAKKKHRGHVNHERYIITYADLITLLLAFFIIMYALADSNPEQMKAFSKALNNVFNPSGEQLVDTYQDGSRQSGPKREPVTADEKKMMASVSEQNELRKTKERIDRTIKAEGLEAEVKTTLGNEGLRIVLTDEILFSSGSADFKQPVNLKILADISMILGEIPNPVTVEGHTDNAPIKTARYPSNWELSADRALTVLRYFIAHQKGEDAVRFSATGYGEFRPMSSNATVEGRKKNRRVEILVKRMNPEGLMIPNQGGDGRE